MSLLLLQGDARQIPLADASVHCVVTSPPYYGLRDYGTGQWVGGEAGCTHRQSTVHVSPRSTLRSDGREHTGPYAGEKAVTEGLPFKDACPRCGAVRVDQQIGLEPLHDCLAWARQEPPCAACWICAMRAVFAEVKRVLRDDGVMFVNVGDAYTSGGRIGHGTRVGYEQQTNRGMNGTSDPPRAPQPPGLREKNLLGLPWRLALALQADSWILRSEIIWEKPSCMPESVQDRFTRSHEQVFLFAKQARYYFDVTAIREPMHPPGIRHSIYGQPGRGILGRQQDNHGGLLDHRGDPSLGRNPRTVWRIPSEATAFAHFATFPTELVRRCLLAGTSAHGCCAACGAPWVRQVERSFRPMTDRSPEKLARASGQKGMDNSRHDHETLRGYVDTHTTGFLPSCACNALTQPCTILDPFCGSGTVPLVARELGHHGIGLDLSLDYLRNIARERLSLAALARWTGQDSPRHALVYGDLPLFYSPEDAP